MTTLNRIASLLRHSMGLDVASVGMMLIERAVSERMTTLGLSQDAYLLALQSAPAELQELIELVIVPETWFFRDREAILSLARMAREQITAQPERCVRVLSLPCSTGEEPYSVAMALLDAGIPPANFHIDAIDICHRSLATAERGVYGRNSFRGKLLEYRDRHFSTDKDESILSELVRKQVHFRHGNMFAPDFLSNEKPYDFVLCRNVLIYFDREMQQQAVQVLDRLLHTQGTIFVGPAEAGVMLRPNLASAGIPLAFAFQKRSTPLPAVTPFRASKPAVPASVKMQALPPIPPLRKPFAPVAPAAPLAAPVAQAASSEAILARAMQCANQGELLDAARLCKEYMQQNGPNAAAYYLMGLISDARHDTGEAMQHYRKAIYLQPNHYEALTHLAALLAAQGDAAGARLMQQRAQRVAAIQEQPHA
ncbi:methyltransferase [Herminiimonas sp. KBW02]|uniref:CheR family methyltransferase n=1 Tax=Herminiimonas sp. KBW02 TaxID=2153363 RepID=UPI000F5A240D|nr:CheR family methyltransferase [Herminiimonas sp. KBW02]RQO37241.1 methyltransferase [Herminiimonas sp. KBW02]